MNSPRVLIVEDERALALALAAAIRQAGASSEIAPTAALARRALSESAPFSAMVLDIGLPDENGLDFLSSLTEDERPPTMVITAHGELDNTITARKLDVAEFLTKPLDFTLFNETLKRILPSPEASTPTDSERSPAAFIGAAPSMRPVFKQIAHACATTDPVLVTGETGTGKTLATTLIHRNSERSNKPLVFLRPGAGTKAGELIQDLQKAAGGVLILEDLEHLDPDSQSELVGRWDENNDAFPRILATSESGLHQAVQEGRFRSDLYYRLQVLEVRLPPLRERLEDLPALFDYFTSELDPKRAATVSEEAVSQLRSYSWPGNLRELRNVASFALTVSSGASTIDQTHLPPHLTEKTDANIDDGESSLNGELDAWINKRLEVDDNGSVPPNYRDLSNELEKLLIERLLVRFDGKLARLASALQANRTTLRKRLRGE